MSGMRLWRKLLRARAMRSQHAVCPVCDLPLAVRYGVLVRLDRRGDFTPENARLIHPECERVAARRWLPGPAQQAAE
jgi:hypothetical protein